VKEMEKRIVISGIGTGGHYFPAVVVAKEFLRRNFDVIFLSRPGFKEERVGRMFGLKIFYINPKPFSGKTIFLKIIALFSFIKCIIRLIPLVKKGIGFSFGGFGALPLTFACLIKRRPFYLFEPNCIPGRATRVVSNYARRVFLGMPSKINLKARCEVTGIPVREEFKNSVYYSNKTEREKRILFIGGSQGAKRLNEWAISLTKILPGEFTIVIISGERDFNWVFERKDSRTVVIPFTDKPWDEIKKAEVVVSRAGALAGYELLTLNKKIVFVPFPYATDNHQLYNAQYFSELGNAIVLEEKKTTEEIIAQKILEMMKRQVENKGEIILDAEKRIVDFVEKETG